MRLDIRSLAGQAPLLCHFSTYPLRDKSALVVEQRSSRPSALLLRASNNRDIFSLGQSIFEVGTQTLQKLGRQFEERPEGFPEGAIYLTSCFI